MLITSTVWKILTVAVAMTISTAGCASPTAEEKAGVEYARQVKVKGFRQVEAEVKEEDVIRYLIGPGNVDVFRDASAPGWSPEPLPSDIPNNDPRFDQLILNHAAVRDGWKCSVGIARLRSGVAPLGAERVTKDEALRVHSGQLAFLRVYVGCRRP